MSNPSIIPVVAKNYSRTASQVEIFSVKVIPFTSATIIVNIRDSSGAYIYGKTLSMDSQTYLQWQNDDTFLQNFVVTQLNYTKTGVVNGYIQITPSDYTQVITQVIVTDVQVIPFTSASIQVNVCDSSSNNIYNQMLIMDTATYLQWMSNDVFLQNFILTKLNLTKA
jgi:hypothetical protein